MALVPLTRGGPEEGCNYESQWSCETLQAHLLSDVGRKRAQNEDFCILCVPEDANMLRDRGVLIGVADGMGGVKGGEFASRLALHSIVDRYYYGGTGDQKIPALLRAAVTAANQRIFEEAETHPEFQGMGTTVSMLAVKGDVGYVAQVGDSRAYLQRGSHIIQLTQDHSLVAEQVRGGLLTEEDARRHALKNLITRAVGTREVVKVDLFAVRLRDGDGVILCSDGLSNIVTDSEIAESMGRNNLQAAARKLVGSALNGGGPDNITVAMIRVLKTREHLPVDEGAVMVRPFSDGLKSFWGRFFR